MGLLSCIKINEFREKDGVGHVHLVYRNAIWRYFETSLTWSYELTPGTIFVVLNRTTRSYRMYLLLDSMCTMIQTPTGVERTVTMTVLPRKRMQRWGERMTIADDGRTPCISFVTGERRTDETEEMALARWTHFKYVPSGSAWSSWDTGTYKVDHHIEYELTEEVN